MSKFIKRFSILASFALILQLVFCLPVQASSLKDVSLLTEPKTLTYNVGQGFKADEISFRCYYTDGKSVDVRHDKITFYANGTPVYNGYAFQVAGTKTVQAIYQDYEYTFTINVGMPTSKPIKDAYMLTEPKTKVYKVGDPFRADEVTVRCVFTDGTTADYGHDLIQFSAGKTQLPNGYLFKEAGSKVIKIRFADFETTFNIDVVSPATKPVVKAEYVTEPQTKTYKVGDPFKADEIVIRCYYKDGTFEDFSSKRLTITTSNDTVYLYNGYKFQQAGTKKITVRIADFSDTFSVNVK